MSRCPPSAAVTTWPRWWPIRRGVLIGLIAVSYVAVCGAVGALIPTSQPTDFDVEIWPAVQAVLNGHPLLVYAPSKLAMHGGPRLAFDHGPVSLIPLSAVGYALTLIGAAGDVRARRAAGLATSAVFTILMAREAIRVAERARGQPFGTRRRVWIAVGIACIPALGFGLSTHGEVPIGMWLYLRSLRDLTDGRLVRSALTAGVAALARSTIVLLLLPVAVFILSGRGVRAAAGWCAVAVVTVTVCMAPFVAADPAGVRTAFVDVRSQQRVSYGSWLVLAGNTRLEPLAQHWDMGLVIAAIMMLLWLVRRAAAAPMGGSSMVAVLTGVAVCFPLLAKSSFPYYLVESGVLVVVWLVSLPRDRRRGPPALVTVLLIGATAGEYFRLLIHPNGDAEFTASIVSAGLMTFALHIIVSALRVGGTTPARSPSVPPQPYDRML